MSTFGSYTYGSYTYGTPMIATPTVATPMVAFAGWERRVAGRVLVQGCRLEACDVTILRSMLHSLVSWRKMVTKPCATPVQGEGGPHVCG